MGRRPTSARFYSTGEILIPGAYENKDFLDNLGRKPKTYNFRSIDREQGPKIGHGYGDKVRDCHQLFTHGISSDTILYYLVCTMCYYHLSCFLFLLLLGDGYRSSWV